MQKENIHIMRLADILTFLAEESIFNLPGYNIVRLDRNSRGEGIAVALRNNIKNTVENSIHTNGNFQGLENLRILLQ